LLIEIHPINLDEVVAYVGKKEIRKPITKANILHNWLIVGTQEAKDMSQVYYSRKIDDEGIKNLMDKLQFVEIVAQKPADK
jgi:hypothetical protein